VLTDSRHPPAWLAEFCRENGHGDFDLGVFEALGTASERIEWIRPTDTPERRFTEPNLVVLLRRGDDRQPPLRHHLGMPEDAFLHQRGLITKAEIRAVTLSKLALHTDHVFWDLGAGSGSITVEAALFIKKGRIVAVERDAERSAQIRRNLVRFGIENATVVQTELPDGLAQLPSPHRVFIGGGGRVLPELIEAVDRRVQPRSRIVLNTVLVANLDGSLKTLEALGYRTEVVQIQVNRSRAMPWSRRLEAENPVWIISGEKNT
jgi:precorrin-6Y C5,15-methyltransferase (decarboxylating)